MTYDRDPGYDEPTPWPLGVLVGVLMAVFVACVVVGIYDVVAQTLIVFGVAAVLVVCGGVAPTAWTWRRRSVLRWLSWGTLAGLGMGLAIVIVVAIAGMA